jgi:ribulose-bisphosphate carboxylase large chain
VRVERIEADYFIETAHDVRKAVEAMAGEQPSGTFVPVPGETPELKARSAARVEKLEVLAECD